MGHVGLLNMMVPRKHGVNEIGVLIDSPDLLWEGVGHIVIVEEDMAISIFATIDFATEFLGEKM